MMTPDGGRTFSVSRHPGPSSPAASSRMADRRRRDTTPEPLIGRALDSCGMGGALSSWVMLWFYQGDPRATSR